MRDYESVCLCKCVVMQMYVQVGLWLIKAIRNMEVVQHCLTAEITQTPPLCTCMSVCTCSEVVAEVCIQFRLKAASNPGGKQMAERIESVCRTTVNGEQSEELVNVLFTHTQHR